MMTTNKSSLEIFKEEQRKYLFTKLRITGIFLVFLLLIPVSRLWYLQIIKGNHFSELSKNNVIKKVRLEAVRGSIFDRNMKLLVSNRPKYDVYFIPKDTETPKNTLKTVAEICNIDYSELYTTYQDNYYSPFHPIKLIENINKYDLAQIMERNLEIPGVYVEHRYKRFYPFNNFASQLLGYVGEISKSDLQIKKYMNFRGGDRIGTYGIEKSFDDYLRGVPGAKYVKYDAKGQNLGDIDIMQEAVTGMSLILSLDSILQQKAEQLLKDKVGSIVVLDPRNGDVLTMASSPGFDPNLFSAKISKKNWDMLQKDTNRPLQNKAIQGLYPPGSTFKIITALSALKKGSFNPESTYFHCKGGPYLQDKFKCWKEEGHGNMNLRSAIINSCNTFFFNLEKFVTINNLVDTSADWAFGELTGIDIPGEKKGFVASPRWKENTTGEKWYRGETLSMLIGQGRLIVTPLQMASFISAIGNGGTFYQPRLVSKTLNWETNEETTYNPTIIKKVEISEKAHAFLKDTLWCVVNEWGTGTKAKLAGYDICGKTGTSQVVGGELTEDYKKGEVPYLLRSHAWFIGFGPKDNPEIAMSVLIEHGEGGGRTAAPIAKELFKTYFESKQSPNPAYIASVQN